MKVSTSEYQHRLCMHDSRLNLLALHALAAMYVIDCGVNQDKHPLAAIPLYLAWPYISHVITLPPAVCS